MNKFYVVALAMAFSLSTTGVEASIGGSFMRSASKRLLAEKAATGEVTAAARASKALAAMRANKTPASIARADYWRDRATPEQSLNKERIVRRYTSAEAARQETVSGIPANTHMTSTLGRGRPLSAEAAKARYGLEKRPERVLTIRVPQGTSVKLNRVLAGSSGYGELTAAKKLPPSDIISNRLVQRSSSHVLP